MIALDTLRRYALTYLATPYAKYPAGIEQAAIDAAKIAADLIRKGVKVYSPIAHSHAIALHGGIDPTDHTIWLPYDSAMMNVCDACIVASSMEGWDASRGVQHEIRYFESFGKPVHFWEAD